MKILSYKLQIDEKNNLTIVVQNHTFQLCPSGQLKFRIPVHGVQYVSKNEWNTLKVYDINDLDLIIVEEGKFEEAEIIQALYKYYLNK